jgi:DNA integrity scanning protein DisA with diadenylate cyclase activity
LAFDYYERRENNGSIKFCKESQQAIYKFKKNKESKGIEFNEKQTRLIRKLLEMTNKKHSLIISKQMIIGLGENKPNDQSTIYYSKFGWEKIYDAFKIVFTKGEYKIEENMSELILCKDIESTIKNRNCGNAEKIETLKALLKQLMDDNHGAGIILSDKAKEEAQRLGDRQRGIMFEPEINFCTKRNHAIFNNLSAIDGALLMDFSLNCYGIGYILDGKAYIDGDTASGARHNSAKCYLINLVGKTGYEEAAHFAIVLSEDGGIKYYDSKVEIDWGERNVPILYEGTIKNSLGAFGKIDW